MVNAVSVAKPLRGLAFWVAHGRSAVVLAPSSPSGIATRPEPALQRKPILGGGLPAIGGQMCDATSSAAVYSLGRNLLWQNPYRREARRPTCRAADDI